MTPKEKAKELICKMYYKIQSDEFGKDNDSAKECALIAVDEIMKMAAPFCDRYERYYLSLPKEKTQYYWQEVKQEIIWRS